MRKWFASLAVLGLCSAAATAQTLGSPPPVGGCGQSQSIVYDDGIAWTSWKVRSPTGHKDYFNVDCNDEAGNMTVSGIALQTFMSTPPAGSNPGIRYIALCPDNLAVDSLGHTPDLNSPLTRLGSRGGTGPAITGVPGPTAGYCPGMLVYDTPDVTVPTTGGAHMVMTFNTGESSTWLCSDFGSVVGRSYFTTTAYTTPATGLGNYDLMMRAVGTMIPPSNGSAYMTVNNATGSVEFPQVATVTTTLWSSAAVQPTLYEQGAFVSGFGFIPAPQLAMSTGFENFAPISDLFQGTLCGPLSDPSNPPCVPAGLAFGFTAFYIDNNDLKKNGNGKIKQTNVVNCLITSDCACNPCPCFGQKDDGQIDGVYWKVQNPAGPADYFNVRFDHTDTVGAPCPNPAVVSSIDVATWDLCGAGTAAWGSIGLYPPDTVVDPSGGTPLLASPISTATSAVLGLPPAHFDTGSAAHTIDIPDVNASTNAVLAGAIDLHTAVGWVPGDSCTWMGSDTDGSDDPPGAGTSVGTASYFTLNGYSTPAIIYPVNWIERINWQ
jgi:hypothetical protein